MRHARISTGRRAAAALTALAIVGVATGSAGASPAVTEQPRSGRSDPEIFTGAIEDFYVVPDRCPEAARAS